MKNAVYMICRETQKVKSYRIYDQELEELQKKVEDYNKEVKETEAIIITDKFTVEALDLKETTETIKSVVDSLVEDFADLKNMIGDEIGNMGYAIENIKSKVEDSLSQKHV